MSGNARIHIGGKTVYHATECTLSFTREMKERSTKDTNGVEKAKGKKSHVVSISALATDQGDGTETLDFGGIFALFNDDTDTQVDWEFIPDEAPAKYKYSGSGVIPSMDGNFVNQEDGTCSFSIEGGAVTQTALPVE